MDFVKERNRKLSKKVIKALENRHMEGYYADTKEEALKMVLELIENGSTVSWGGCQSGIEIGLFDQLKQGDYNVLDRDDVNSHDEIEEIMAKAMTCDYYIMSSNAISQDGILINIDGRGNRVAALIYGPKNVIVIAGINKIEATEELALKRARDKASPINNIRLDTKNPCTIDGICHNCVNNTICANIVTTRASRIPNRIKVILVGEEIGF